MNATDYTQALVEPKTPILEVLKIIDSSSQQIALVVDSERRLIGTATDGDVRRGLLRGVKLGAPIEQVMNSSPHVALPGLKQAALIKMMLDFGIRHLPIVNSTRQVIGLERYSVFPTAIEQSTLVVLMVGGLGKRLHPMTETTPKPMIQIGGRPLLETIVENLSLQGFREILMAINYRGDMVKSHFGDGKSFGISIRYLEEDEPRGTAGALSLLPERPSGPFIVMNGDLVTKVNFQQLMDYHHNHDAAATMCVREYTVKVPYGIVETAQHRLVALREKPEHQFFVNAGIYVLEPQALDLIPPDGVFDMTALFSAMLDKRWETAAFALREYWLDIGRLDDLERARLEYQKVFNT